MWLKAHWKSRLIWWKNKYRNKNLTRYHLTLALCWWLACSGEYFSHPAVADSDLSQLVKLRKAFFSTLKCAAVINFHKAKYDESANELLSLTELYQTDPDTSRLILMESLNNHLTYLIVGLCCVMLLLCSFLLKHKSVRISCCRQGSAPPLQNAARKPITVGQKKSGHSVPT